MKADMDSYKREIKRMVDEINNLPVIIKIYTFTKTLYIKLLQKE